MEEMHSILRGYQRPTTDEFRQLWTEGTFFVDTSVLLNLYRFPQPAREDLLAILEQVGERVRVPFQAALEFERNRLTVIADQKRRFRDVRDAVSAAATTVRGKLDSFQLKKRHSLIDAEEFLAKLDAITSEFVKRLADLERAQMNVNEHDETRERLRALIGDRVGTPPADQETLDQIYEAGKRRFERSVPPGYRDEAKDPPTFEFAGLLYDRRYGDYLLWEQIILIAKSEGLKSVVLVSDDEKEDWWWIVDSDGKKRIGPRPELVEEIGRRAGVRVFYMYNSEQLLRWSREYLKVDLKKESIDQVRETKQALRHVPLVLEQFRKAEQAVRRWLLEIHPDATLLESHGFPDFIVETADSQRIGYEVVPVTDARNALLRVRERLYHAYFELDERRYGSLWLVLPGVDSSGLDRLRTFVQREGPRLAEKIGFVTGSVIETLGDHAVFAPEIIIKPGRLAREA